MHKSQLLDKYNVAAPRYTSYPTVPYWQTEKPSETEWIQAVQDAAHDENAVGLYIHLPFCESLCTYCGCNKRITKQHNVEHPYIETVLQEWQLYLDILSETPILKEIHLGGGTPTFFSPQNLSYLIESILATAEIAPDHEFGFEAHPNSTTDEHLQTLYDLGFRRISIGVQDFDNDILKIINRQQSYEEVERVTLTARQMGYTSINYDLIFGLPLQTPENMLDNIQKVRHLRPDRIAFYSYAHVPWIKPSQRAYSEADLPNGEEKRTLYEMGCELLEAASYVEIGMDHFALKTDSLHQAAENDTLHRNFMGYTPHYTRLSVALGASSISDTWTAYVQNEKGIETYQEIVQSGHFPIIKGHLLTEEDQILRQHILDIMCHYETHWQNEAHTCATFYEGLERLTPLVEDGLVEIEPFQLRVTEAGRPFLRNICMALDARYWRKKPEGALFSQVV